MGSTASTTLVRSPTEAAQWCMGLFVAFDYAILTLLALSLPVLVIAVFLRHEQRRKLLDWLSRKWTI
jgi:hypothetical protein